MDTIDAHSQEPAQAEKAMEQAMDSVEITGRTSHDVGDQLSAESDHKLAVGPIKKERNMLQAHSSKARLTTSNNLQPSMCLKDALQAR